MTLWWSQGIINNMDLWMRISCFGARLVRWTVLQNEMAHNFRTTSELFVTREPTGFSMSDCGPGRVTKLAIGLADFCCYG